MCDPRLNSVHLQTNRKQRFRAARSSLLNATGSETMAGQVPNNQHLREGNTAILCDKAANPTQLPYALADREFLYPLKVGINTVGRMPDNDVVIANPYVSRRHVAIVVHANSGCEIHDIASKNGTLINGKPIAGPTKLKSGDRIQLSDYHLVFLNQSDSPSGFRRDPTQVA